MKFNRIISVSAAILVASCSGPSGGRSSSAAADGALSSNGVDVEKVYEVYFGDPRTPSPAVLDYQVRRELATDARIAECMRRSGFEFAARPERTIREEYSMQGLVRSKAEREATGFGISFPASDGSDGAAATSRTQGPKTEAAAAGLGECEGAARAQQRAIDLVIEQFRPQFVEVFSRFKADPIVLKAEGAWQSCMKLRGYRVSTVEALKELLTSEVQAASSSSEDLAALQQKERQAALDDYNCNDANRDAVDGAFDRIVSDFNDSYRASILEALRKVPGQ